MRPCSKKGRHQVLKIKYFSSRVKSSEKDPSKAERQMAYWRALGTIPDIEIIEGRLKKKEVRRKFISPLGQGIQRGEIVTVERYEEKESDVNIASQIILDSAQGGLDCIILLSNDTDLKMPLHISRKKFKKKIGIIAPLDTRMHFELKKVSNFQLKITKDMLKECQFPASLEDGIVKPVNW